MHLSFYPLEKKHLDLVLGWLKKEHVQKYFYGEGLENTLKNIYLFASGISHNQDYSFELWIASIEDEPLGFFMTSLVEKDHDPYNKWFVEGEKVITLDLLIGEEKYLGKGIAHRMIQEFLIDKFSDVSTVLIDPSANNKKAIHVYEKAGFKKVKQFIPTFDSLPHWMMRLEMKDLKEKQKRF